MNPGKLVPGTPWGEQFAKLTRAANAERWPESCGGEVVNSSWLAQVSGKSSGDSLEINQDIRPRRGMRRSDLPSRLNRAHITIQYHPVIWGMPV
jgi:hypothetical protein